MAKAAACRMGRIDERNDHERNGGGEQQWSRDGTRYIARRSRRSPSVDGSHARRTGAKARRVVHGHRRTMQDAAPRLLRPIGGGHEPDEPIGSRTSGNRRGRVRLGACPFGQAARKAPDRDVEPGHRCEYRLSRRFRSSLS
jgi:hypothetical protein